MVRCTECIHFETCKEWAIDCFHGNTIFPYKAEKKEELCEYYKAAADVVPKSEFDELQNKYELAVAEREANVKGFAEELLKLKTEVTRKIIDDLANKGLLNIEAWAIEEFKKKYTEGEK